MRILILFTFLSIGTIAKDKGNANEILNMGLLENQYIIILSRHYTDSYEKKISKEAQRTLYENSIRSDKDINRLKRVAKKDKLLVLPAQLIADNMDLEDLIQLKISALKHLRSKQPNSPSNYLLNIMDNDIRRLEKMKININNMNAVQRAVFITQYCKNMTGDNGEIDNVTDFYSCNDHVGREIASVQPCENTSNRNDIPESESDPDGWVAPDEGSDDYEDDDVVRGPSSIHPGMKAAAQENQLKNRARRKVAPRGNQIIE